MASTRLTLIFAATLAAACERETIVRVHSTIAVSPAALELAEVLLGTSVTKVITVENQGDTALKICFADALDNDCDEGSRVLPEGVSAFQVDFEGRQAGQAWLVEPGSPLPILVTYAPQAEGAAGVTLVLVSDAQNEQRTLIPISGSSIGPDVELSTAVLDYGEVTVSQRKVLEVTLTNHTAYATPFEASVPDQTSLNYGTEESNGADTAIGGARRGMIDGNGTTIIRVWYQPTEEGANNNSLIFKYCAGCFGEVSLTGRGVRPVVTLSPDALDFGTLGEGQAAVRSFSIANSGNTGLWVEGVELEGGATQEFAPQAPAALPQLLPPGGTISVPVTYLGVTPGNDSARVLVRTNAWDDPNTPANESVAIVTLTAISTGPDIDALPARLSFGSVPVGTTGHQPMLLQNTGNAPLTVNQLRLTSGGPAMVLTGVPSLPTVIQPGSSVVATVDFTPTASGMATGTIEVISNDRDEASLIIPLDGIGALPNVCVLDLGRTAVNFGLVSRGRVARLPLVVTNVGGQQCSVSNIRLSNAATPLSMGAASSANFTLVPGESHRIELSYSPIAYGTHNGQLELDTTDPSAAHVTVPVSGSSAQSSVVVSPSSLDFGTVPDGCGGGQRVINVYNTGATLVTLQSVSLDPSTPADFRLLPLTVPLSIPAGGQTSIIVSYHGNGADSDFGVLFIQHSDSVVPVAVPLDGKGTASPAITDAFAQLARAADVLFVVDNSCSMEEEQASLGSNLSAFLSFALGQGVDFHIAVTTTDVDRADAGAFVGTTRVITPTTPNIDATFQTNVNQGIFGAVDEKGLEAAFLALSDPMLSGTNSGFMRPDTMLSVIFISDEEDQSTRPRAFYESFLKNVKGDPTLVTASAVVGITNPECVTANGVGDYAPRYINVANALGGITESICSLNWGTALTNIGQSTFGIRRNFPLSSQPVAGTITVNVNGAPAAAGSWSYDTSSNSVSFTSASVPAVGAAIDVTYTLACLP